ncbi:MAG: NAD(P)H-dependent oxidoreductase [Patescibacteria group bacterium]
MSSFLNNLNWRFATKRFLADKKISQDDFNKILQAIRLAPTSFGLQPFHVLVVNSQAVKEKLYSVSREQKQVLEAEYLLIFCSRLDMLEQVEKYVAEGIKVNPNDAERLEKLKIVRQEFFNNKTTDEILNWSARQAYLALGFALAACAELQIDSCPMEGFEKKKVDEVLELPSYLKSLAYLAIGYRAEEPTRDKVRLPENNLFTYL